MARNKTKLVSREKKKKAFPLWLLLTGLGLILVAVWALASNASRSKATVEVSGAPSIKVEQDRYDYGDVQLGVAPIRSEVKVTNVGDQTLQFTQAPYVEVLEGC